MNLRVQRLADHDQQIVQAPIVRCSETMRPKICLQVSDRLLAFTPSDCQRPSAISPSAATEAFADVRAYRLGGSTRLADVQQTSRYTIE